jgi:glycosyltransferase A (GT-A) superfamily protein (DUF2064 family)
VVVIGSDCIEIGENIVRETKDALNGGAKLVLGPTHDGGYYLIATSGYYPFLFDDISWSTGKVFSQTLRIANSHGLRTYQLPWLNDIDTLKDVPENMR